jgi:hypothetical protein
MFGPPAKLLPRGRRSSQPSQGALRGTAPALAVAFAVAAALPGRAQTGPARGPEVPPLSTEAAACLARFAELPILEQAALVRRIERRCDQLVVPVLRRMAAWRQVASELPASPHAPCFDPNEWAKGVAPTRTHVGPDSQLHAAVRGRYPRVAFCDDLHARVQYDWGTGTVVASPTPPTFAQLFENALRGYPPGSDEVLARLLAALDRDPRQRRLAHYFEHTWADLEAKAYEGVTLYEAWYSSTQVDVPDVDAIPFAVQILGDQSYVSPIPANARRTALYAKIQAAALEHRRYRSLVLAAAVAVVRAEPVFDPAYAPLVPRFHLTWARSHDEAPAVARELSAAVADREAWISALDGEVRERPELLALRDGRKRALAELERCVSEIAREELLRGSTSRTR